MCLQKSMANGGQGHNVISVDVGLNCLTQAKWRPNMNVVHCVDQKLMHLVKKIPKKLENHKFTRNQQFLFPKAKPGIDTRL